MPVKGEGRAKGTGKASTRRGRVDPKGTFFDSAEVCATWAELPLAIPHLSENAAGPIYDDEGRLLFENPSHVEDSASRLAERPPVPNEPNSGRTAVAPNEPNSGRTAVAPNEPNRATARRPVTERTQFGRVGRCAERTQFPGPRDGPAGADQSQRPRFVRLRVDSSRERPPNRAERAQFRRADRSQSGGPADGTNPIPGGQGATKRTQLGSPTPRRTNPIRPMPRRFRFRGSGRGPGRRRGPWRRGRGRRRGSGRPRAGSGRGRSPGRCS
jgi:hypothetical protein